MEENEIVTADQVETIEAPVEAPVGVVEEVAEEMPEVALDESVEGALAEEAEEVEVTMDEESTEDTE